jgi:hypothetical protein
MPGVRDRVAVVTGAANGPGREVPSSRVRRVAPSIPGVGATRYNAGHRPQSRAAWAGHSDRPGGL